MGRLQELWEGPLWWKLGIVLGFAILLTCKGHLILAFEGDGMWCSFAMPLNNVYI